MEKVVVLARLLGLAIGIAIAGRGVFVGFQGQDTRAYAIGAILAVILGTLPWAVTHKD